MPADILSHHEKLASPVREPGGVHRARFVVERLLFGQRRKRATDRRRRNRPARAQCLERAQRLAAELDAQVVDGEQILRIEADVFAPCALGGVLNDDSIPALGAPIVAGGANNQLLEDRHGEALAERGVLYAPDYVINAGGIINVCGEYLGQWTEAEVDRRVAAIGDTLGEIFREAKRSGRPTHRVADAMARQRIGLEV